MAYKTISTAYGLSRQAAASTSGVPIVLAAVALGDSNGLDVEPSRDQTQLVREQFRTTINRVYQSPDDSTVYVVEATIPAAVGGWNIREAGIFDEHNGLVSVSKIPLVYKPLPTEGAFGDVVLRLFFRATNDSVISLIFDPNVAVASHQWVLNTITPGFLLPGGTTGQIAKKRSNTDGDIIWGDPDEFNVTVDTVEDPQVLGAGQISVDLVTTTTRGLAVYINGSRINRGSAANEWQPAGTSVTRILLGQAYAAESRFLAVQNEPAGSAPTPLERSKNLSDVENAATARTNLGVYSKEEARSKGKQPGDVFYTARSTPPPGSMRANFAELSRTVYWELFDAIGTRYGAGDGFNTFNVFDGRGDFIRGLDDGRGVDPGRVLGSRQGSQNQLHTHVEDEVDEHSHDVVGDGFSGIGDADGDNSYVLTSNREVYAGGTMVRMRTRPAGRHRHDIGGSGGNESRPTNTALLCCIAF